MECTSQPLRILVLARATPDNALPLPILDGKPDFSIVNWVLNPFDEVAVEAAVKLKQQNSTADQPIEVIIAGYQGSAGIAAVERALSMGGDRAMLLSEDALSSQEQSSQLAGLILSLQPELIMIGRLAIGTDKGEFAGMVAGKLNLPLVTGVSEITLENTTLSFLQRRMMQSRLASIQLPAVISSELDLAIPRYVTLPALVAAKRKPKSSFEFSHLMGRPPEHPEWHLPPKRSGGKKVDSVDGLIHELKQRGVSV